MLAPPPVSRSPRRRHRVLYCPGRAHLTARRILDRMRMSVHLILMMESSCPSQSKGATWCEIGFGGSPGMRSLAARLGGRHVHNRDAQNDTKGGVPVGGKGMGASHGARSFFFFLIFGLVLLYSFGRQTPPSA